MLLIEFKISRLDQPIYLGPCDTFWTKKANGSSIQILCFSRGAFMQIRDVCVLNAYAVKNLDFSSFFGINTCM